MGCFQLEPTLVRENERTNERTNEGNTLYMITICMHTWYLQCEGDADINGYATKKCMRYPLL
jgi:hypothetical protein